MTTKYSTVLAAMLLALLASCPLVSTAQIHFGVRAGLNVSNVSFDNLPQRSERFGYHLGVFAEVPVVPDFMTVQPELSYSVQGAAFKPLNKRQTLNMSYVNLLLPVAFKLGSVDIQVGPFASFLTSNPDYTVYNENRVVVNAFKKMDAGLTAGLSFNLHRLLLGIRFNQGLVVVTKNDAQPLLGKGKNSVGQVSLGFKF